MMQPLRRVLLLAVVAVPASAQSPTDSAAVAEAVVQLVGARLAGWLSDSSGAVFRVPTDSGWVVRTLDLIRTAFPRTARPVGDSAHAVWLTLSAPTFERDTVEVEASWSQCRNTSAAATPVEKFLNFAATEQRYRFHRSVSGEWRRLKGTIQVFDGSCPT
jgi:hypothetical protein